MNINQLIADFMVYLKFHLMPKFDFDYLNLFVFNDKHCFDNNATK